MTLEELAEKLEPHWVEYQTYKRATIGEGWADLVSDLVDDLEKVDPDFKVVQVKEKFGGLRFYLEGYSNNLSEKEQNIIDGLINSASSKSLETCETCGKKGYPKGYWVLTLCDECRENEKYE